VAEVVNLRLARKAQKREEDRRLASENAARHAQSKAVKTLHEAKVLKAETTLDQHRRDPK
jgi:hypothetical protein